MISEHYAKIGEEPAQIQNSNWAPNSTTRFGGI